MNVAQALGLPLELATLQQLIKGFLSASVSWRWTVQGFGLLRFDLADIARIHIWDSRLRYDPDVSTIHDHSWRLRSLIVAGLLKNQRYVVAESLVAHMGDDPAAIYHGATIVAGVHSDLKLSNQRVVRLRAFEQEYYLPGYHYTQEAAELHETIAEDGTVTLMERKHDGPTGEANVFWPYGTIWKHAKPRPATPDEVHAVVTNALKRFP